jgi:hypothetical protein
VVSERAFHRNAGRESREARKARREARLRGKKVASFRAKAEEVDRGLHVRAAAELISYGIDAGNPIPAEVDVSHAGTDKRREPVLRQELNLAAGITNTEAKSAGAGKPAAVSSRLRLAGLKVANWRARPTS